MRYAGDESTYIVGKFNVGDTVTITIIRLSDSVTVVSAAPCSPEGVTGVFKYQFQQAVTVKQEYLYIMTNGTLSSIGKIVLSGYVDYVVNGLEFLQDIEGGDWRRDGTQMIFYKAGGAEIARFNLFKFDGTPATEQDVEVARRQRV